MKRKLLALGMATMMATAMVGCGENVDVATESGEPQYTVGISQFAEHGSLDNCVEGFVEGLAEAGLVEGENLTIDFQNAQADMGTAGQISSTFVNGKVDMIVGVATPTAQSAYNAAMDTDIPVIFTAVTDPIAAELAGVDGMPVGEITGTSDQLAIEAQLKMMREILPEATKLGILYTTSEVNSVTAIEEYEVLVGAYGFELVTKGITSVAEVAIAAQDLLSQVDCVTNLTDNTVVSALPTVIALANEASVPVFGSEVEQVKLGCLAAEGLDYLALGRQTGAMAAKILKGEEKASEMMYETIAESQLCVNTAVAEQLGVELAEELLERASEVFDVVE